MANNKKRKYHRPPASKNMVQKPVRLSQCMIVKNEEKNIEKALSWAKPIAFEQIVVDTGSTDRTVEIAGRMGAKVYHFEWIKDFSAAKNYAIEQAKGDWIAFLDADEYISEKDARELARLLRQISNDANLSKMKTALQCPWIQLDDKGTPFLTLAQQRIFRNVPEIRYIGRIHEGLTLSEPVLTSPDINIMHTGYSKTSYKDTGKAVRNVEMIEAELARRPDDASLKCYLADSLRIDGPCQDAARAEALYREALSGGQFILPDIEQGAYNYLVAKYYEDETQAEENLGLCKRAYEKFPENPDFCFYYGRKKFLAGDYEDAFAKFTECENLLKGQSVSLAGFILKNSLLLFFNMVLTAEHLGNMSEVIRCATLVLKEDKYQPGMLAPYIQAFKRPGYETSDDEIYKLLNKLYDFKSMKDKITVMRAANDAGNMEIAARVMAAFTPEELEWLSAE